MNAYNIEFVEDLGSDVLQRVELGHADDEAQKGVACAYKKISFLGRNKAGEVVGVLRAYTAWVEVYVDDIWVDPNYRKQGIGRALLNALEEHFQNKGYCHINLVTSQFQAPEFYKKCGYEVEFVRVHKQDPLFTKTFFIKYLEEAL